MFITFDLCFSYLFELDDAYCAAHQCPPGASAEFHQFLTGCY